MWNRSCTAGGCNGAHSPPSWLFTAMDRASGRPTPRRGAAPPSLAPGCARGCGRHVRGAWAYRGWRSGAGVAACRLRRRRRPSLTAADAEDLPLMRQMPLALSGDRGARAADLQYLLGPDILDAPVLERGGERTFFAPP